MNVTSVYSRAGSHAYEGLVIDADEDPGSLVTKLKNILSDTDTTNALLSNFETLGLAGFSSERLNEIANLDLPESYYANWRVGEALGEVLLEENYNCWVPFSKTANTTNHNTSNTGIDIIGIAADPAGNMLLLFAEVKTSSEAASPPQVVHSSKADCLTNQLKDILKNKKKRDEHMRYLAKEFGTDHPQIQRFIDATRRYLDGEYAVYGVVVRSTSPNKNDLEATSNALIADTDCEANETVLLSLHHSTLDNLAEMVRAA